jgi:hypothetical protein
VLFFGPDGERQPERDVRERKAKAICAQCPVRTECLDYALSRPEKYGTWGGLNEDERASERPPAPASPPPDTRQQRAPRDRAVVPMNRGPDVRLVRHVQAAANPVGATA